MKTLSIVLFVFLTISSCKCNEKEAKKEDMPCGVCPDKKMVCNGNKCDCPVGTYKLGNFCKTKKSNQFTANFKNTPLACKETGTLSMPDSSTQNWNQCEFAIFFPDGYVAETSQARYYNFMEYELVQDDLFILSYDFSNGVCDQNHINYTSFTARKNRGSNEVSVFFSAFDKDVSEPTDTFTIVFRQ